ncbi:hypothetical protein SSX86_014590 [Deinandra increscens subsp. villosa]|uniref:Uncharacterized protein n=1 Tax=Deinandra increscens subsp. villosa TaxID=3103831 RepID=A0AAP0D2I8_9ASTR
MLIKQFQTQREAYELHTMATRSGIDVLAFNDSADYTAGFLGEFHLVSYKELQVVDFIPTKVNPSFSTNKAVVQLFEDLDNYLKKLEHKYINTPLIITGSGLGGYLAILSTLRLQHAIDVEESINGSKKTKRPICITFGSPLVGDASFQCAIAERPKWKSSFLNVVARKDPVASFFSSIDDTPYKPLGTFLFCTESGGHAAFEDQDLIMAILDVMRLSNADNSQVCDYTDVLSSMRKKVMYRGVPGVGELDLNLLRAGITLQLKKVDLLKSISDDQIVKMEKEQIDIFRKKNLANAYDPTKKLNDSKISLTYMEWYMKTRKREGGYYDSYKNPKSREEIEKKQEMVRHKRTLNQYWEKFIDEKDKMPQKEGAKLRKRWLYSGNNYRRIVEPLDIVEYYLTAGNTNYTEKRSNHYKLLEKWSKEDKEVLKTSEEKRSKAASLTEDSCFWAHVEEALIKLKELKNGGSNSNTESRTGAI